MREVRATPNPIRLLVPVSGCGPFDLGLGWRGGVLADFPFGEKKTFRIEMNSTNVQGTISCLAVSMSTFCFNEINENTPKVVYGREV